MWNRAPRIDRISESNKLPNVSPASYTPYPKLKKKACCVPFNCSARAHALADNGVPAPCTYNIRYRKHRIKGGASLRFKEPRNTFSYRSGPSPLSYDPDLLYKQEPEYQTGGKIFKGKPPRYGYIPAVSIPYKLFDGFDIIKGKKLILRPPRLDFREHIEPMFQHFPYEFSKTTLKYKGNQWSKLQAKRKFLYSGDPESPGPGHYDLLDKPPKSWDLYLTKLRSYNVAMADSLRWTDRCIKRQVYEDQPGPTTYTIVAKQIFEHQSFNVKRTFTKDKRFKYPKIITLQQSLNLTPPPTLTSTQRFWPPFNNSSDARLKIKKTEASPAKYHVLNYSISYALFKKLVTVRVNVPFNSSSKRKSLFFDHGTPGPGTYNLLDKPKRIVYGARDVNTYIPPVRLRPLRDRKKKNEVAPCTYNISRAMKSLYKKKDCHHGPTWVKEKKFDRTKWSIKDSPDALYNYKDIGALTSGQPIFNKRTDPKEIHITPGPADYYIHPLYTEGCLRAIMTHNATSDLNHVVLQSRPVQKRKSFLKFLGPVLNCA